MPCFGLEDKRNVFSLIKFPSTIPVLVADDTAEAVSFSFLFYSLSLTINFCSRERCAVARLWRRSGRRGDRRGQVRRRRGNGREVIVLPCASMTSACISSSSIFLAHSIYAQSRKFCLCSHEFWHLHIFLIYNYINFSNCNAISMCLSCAIFHFCFKDTAYNTL